MKASDDVLLPVLIGIVGEGNCIDPKNRLLLQQTTRELIQSLKTQYPFTPVYVLCGRKNDLEIAVSDTAIEYTDGQMQLEDSSPAFLAKNSQILIVVRSDTSPALDRLIESRIGGKQWDSHFSGILHQTERGPVWEVSCSAQKMNVRKLYPAHPNDKDPSHRYDLICKHIDRFNQDATKLNSNVVSTPILLEEERSSLNAPLNTLLKQFEICDRLAIYYQKRTYAFYVALFLFSFTTLFFYEIYGTLVPSAPFRPELYLASLMLAFLTYFLGRKKDYENKYLDYRALAEGVRVQFFWSLMDLRLPVSDHYLHKTENELIWIRSALRAWHIRVLGKKEECALPIGGRLEITFKRWVQDQSRYFTNAGTRDNKQLKWLKFSSSALLVFAGVFAFLRIFVRTQQGWILAATGLAPAIGALMKGYIQKRGLPEHVKQYGRMAELYSLAQTYYGSLGNREDLYEDAMGLIQELGKEALAENAEWVLLHRDRRVTFPKPK